MQNILITKQAAEPLCVSMQNCLLESCGKTLLHSLFDITARFVAKFRRSFSEPLALDTSPQPAIVPEMFSMFLLEYEKGGKQAGRMNS